MYTVDYANLQGSSADNYIQKANQVSATEKNLDSTIIGIVNGGGTDAQKETQVKSTLSSTYASLCPGGIEVIYK